ncbi:Uncharacterized protein dnm_037380 [Desulfonema magnum]|uniref:Uncharacterized protein n=1 Tax=Desulfonema magnum TaxID=45655 RepID=A0A975GNF0_9BACT|nr:Uncharacterized protein dnm_037380 [Desulfonema magnum]
MIYYKYAAPAGLGGAGKPAAANKYLTISFRYLPGEETRLFYRKDPRTVTEKPGFLRSSQKKRYIKNF